MELVKTIIMSSLTSAVTAGSLSVSTSPSFLHLSPCVRKCVYTSDCPTVSLSSFACFGSRVGEVIICGAGRFICYFCLQATTVRLRWPRHCDANSSAGGAFIPFRVFRFPLTLTMSHLSIMFNTPRRPSAVYMYVGPFADSSQFDSDKIQSFTSARLGLL